MSKIIVGLIGAGKIGQIHANNMLQSDDLHLKTVADPFINQSVSDYLSEYSCRITSDPEDIFQDEEIEAVFICSLTETHAPYIIKAARAGKHIFCEKPISLHIENSMEALKVVQECGVKLQIGFNRRFDKHFKKIHDLVSEGAIGNQHLIKISSRDPQPPPHEYIGKSGGMFIDMTIHDFDMVRFITGSEVNEISVKASNLVDPVFSKYNDVDTAVITMMLENGAIAVIDNSRQAVYGYDQRVEVFGSKGVIETENEKETNIKVSTRESVSLDHPKYFFLERYKDAYVNEIHEFALAIKHNSNVLSSGTDGIEAETLAIAAKKSLEEGRTISISEIDVFSMIGGENV